MGLAWLMIAGVIAVLALILIIAMYGLSAIFNLVVWLFAGAVRMLGWLVAGLIRLGVGSSTGCVGSLTESVTLDSERGRAGNAVARSPLESLKTLLASAREISPAAMRAAPAVASSVLARRSSSRAV